MKKLLATALLLSAMLAGCWPLPLGLKKPDNMDDATLDSLIGASSDDVIQKLGTFPHYWTDDSRRFLIYQANGEDRYLWMDVVLPLQTDSLQLRFCTLLEFDNTDQLLKWEQKSMPVDSVEDCRDRFHAELSHRSLAADRPFTNFEGDLPKEQIANLESFFVSRIWNADETLVYSRSGDGIHHYHILLLPGTYVIEYIYNGGSVRYPYRRDTVKLEPGHSYTVKRRSCFVIERIFGACWGRADYTGTLWIEDDATGQVVAGEKWDY